MEDTVNSACEAATTRLRHANLSVELDLRHDLTPGSKFYYWELRGIPVRVEIGPRDVENNEATIVRRDTLTRQTCKTDELEDVVIGLLEKMKVDLKEKAWRWMRRHVYRVDNLSRAKQLLKDRAGVVEVFWCGRDECGRNLEEEVNARVLGVPEDVEGEIDGQGILCGRKAVQLVRLAQAY
jgi:prolyl-tRNA synthetase